MPEAPSVNPITRFLFENPWPLGGLLLAVAAVTFWLAVRNGQVRRMGIAAAIGGAGGLVLILGTLVVTSGERAAAATRGFVEAVAAGDLLATSDAIADDGALIIGAPNNPGLSRTFLMGLINRALDRYTITSNRITNLDAWSQGPDEGLVHLTCRTDGDAGYPAVTRWVITVRRQPDDEWRIFRLVWISVNGRDADRGLLP